MTAQSKLDENEVREALTWPALTPFEEFWGQKRPVEPLLMLPPGWKKPLIICLCCGKADTWLHFERIRCSYPTITSLSYPIHAAWLSMEEAMNQQRTRRTQPLCVSVYLLINIHVHVWQCPTWTQSPLHLAAIYIMLLEGGGWLYCQCSLFWPKI